MIGSDTRNKSSSEKRNVLFKIFLECERLIILFCVLFAFLSLFVLENYKYFMALSFLSRYLNRALTIIVIYL